MVKLKAKKSWDNIKEGEEFETSKKSAENYISQGFAEYIEEKEEATKKETLEDSNVAKQILDRWATAVVPKEAIFKNKQGQPQVNQDHIKHYDERGYQGDEVLWIAPKDCIRFEFEKDKKENHRIILELESVAKSLELDYCITSHDGKSDYFNMFNIKGIPLGEDNQSAKLLFADMLISANYKDFLDRTNLGWTLSPVIEHPHWKPKYKGNVHKIIRGKDPLEHKNKYPRKLLTKIDQAKTMFEKKNKFNTNDKWVEEFLLDYCCNNELPSGSRHLVIEKNLAALIIFRKDKEQIKKAYYKAQGRKHDSLRTWERAILSGQYPDVSAGELGKFIKDYGLKFNIPKQEEKVIDLNTGEFIEDKDSLQYLKNKCLTYIASKQVTKATELLVKEYKKNNYVYTTREDEKSEIWIYHEGIYIPQGKTYIKEFVRNVLGETFTTYICNNIIAKIEADTYIDSKEFFDNNIVEEIPVENGLLNIFTKELKPFDPNKVFFTKLKFPYDKNKDCPNIKEHIKTILKDEDDIKVMQELFGYLLLKDNKLERAFMFNGFGRNGKSKTLELIKYFVGHENSSSIPLSQIEKGGMDVVSELFGKLVNISGDIGKTAINNTGTFKELVGRDLITAPRKFLPPIYFVNFCKMVFSGNELPKTKDLTDGFWDKWIYLEFPYKFITQEEMDRLEEHEKINKRIIDPNIIDKLNSKDELSGLINWGLEGLDRLLKQNKFSYSKTTENVKKIWLRKSDSFNAFIMDELEEHEEGWMEKKILRKRYHDYCKKHKLKPSSDKTIKDSLAIQLGSIEDRINHENKQLHVWTGIRIKDKQKHIVNDKSSQGSQGVSYYSKKLSSPMYPKTMASLTKNKEIVNYIYEFDKKTQSHTPCYYPIEDEMCCKTPTNEFNGSYYCEKHFKQIQMENTK